MATPPGMTEQGERRERRPRTAARLLVVALVATAVVGSGRLLTDAGVRAAGGPDRAVPVTGAWFCPHGGGPGWSGWVIVTNPGRSTVHARVTTFGETGRAGVQSFDVGPSQEVYRKVPSTDPGAASEVEYFGGWVAASAVVRSVGDHADVAAERCVTALRGGWLLPDERTDPSQHEQASLVVMNPFATAAEFDVVIRTNTRTIEPGDLKPFVLAAGTSRAIDLNRWALEAADEDTVSAQVVPHLGRVIAGSVVVSDQGVRAEAGLQSVADSWILPASGYAGPADLMVLGPGARQPVISVVASGETGRQQVSGLSGVTLPARTAKTFEVSALPGAPVEVSVPNRTPVAAALRVAGPNGGIAMVEGYPAPARRWLVAPVVPPAGGSLSLVLQNPGTSAATLTVALLGTRGPVAASWFGTVSVPAGAAVILALPAASGPISALITVTAGSVVAGESGTTLGAGYASTSGVPVPRI
jgi:uncharacterized protein DUF5719